jgi:hypothetical protein
VNSFPSVRFYTHFFTSYGKQAYDPIHTRRVPITHYMQQTFKEDNLSLTLRASTEEVREELENRTHRYLENKLVG